MTLTCWQRIGWIFLSRRIDWKVNLDIFIIEIRERIGVIVQIDVYFSIKRTFSNRSLDQQVISSDRYLHTDCELIWNEWMANVVVYVWNTIERAFLRVS